MDAAGSATGLHNKNIYQFRTKCGSKKFSFILKTGAIIFFITSFIQIFGSADTYFSKKLTVPKINESVPQQARYPHLASSPSSP
jgi:hypothetical protein